jgi:hypothetical protein
MIEGAFHRASAVSVLGFDLSYPACTTACFRASTFVGFGGLKILRGYTILIGGEAATQRNQA